MPPELAEQMARTIRIATVPRKLHKLVAVAGSLMILGGCIAADDPDQQFYVGNKARERLFGLPQVRSDRVPASATDFRFYDGGNFNGLDLYWTYSCATVDDCYRAIEAMGGPTRNQFQPWRASRLGVIMDGPRHGIEGFQPAFWPIRAVTNGVQVEVIWGGNQALDYDAIDLDRRIVFHQRSSGGFDAGPPRGR